MSKSIYVCAAMMLLAFLAVSCNDESDRHNPGGPCTYDTIPGSALIIVADSAVTFDFTPDDPTAPDRYRFTYIPDSGAVMFISPDSAVRSQWLADNGFEDGITYPCNRLEITAGTCAPLVFGFPQQIFPFGYVTKQVIFAGT